MHSFRADSDLVAFPFIVINTDSLSEELVSILTYKHSVNQNWQDGNTPNHNSGSYSRLTADSSLVWPFPLGLDIQ